MQVNAVATQRVRGVAYACAVVSLFCAFVLISRMGLSTELTLPDIAALRFGVGGLVLSPILIRHGLSGLRPAEAVLLAALGGLGFGLFAYAGFALAPAAHGSILIHGALPLTTALLLKLFCGCGMERSRQVSLGAIPIGVAVVIWDGSRLSAGTVLMGDFCLLAASFCWSGYGLYAKRMGIPAVKAAAIVAGISATLFLPVYAALPGTTLFSAAWPDIALQGFFQGVLIGALSVFIYTRAVALLGAAEIALFTATVPGLTALGGYLLLGEAPSGASLAGLGLVTCGTVLGLRRAG
ncbi:hypothetical protein ASE63_22035 [Bosea sp. Root381]|uniref:DMT family transporter n=1 Tax=Bosea sp. Root381 TaxID=1736524 RepID=UPI0006F52751|nr:DMT family transporter [Bosea sp. Root381]KRE08013.1 hypothetical protein ASE63_22035 [Bosea sp. Root381]